MTSSECGRLGGCHVQRRAVNAAGYVGSQSIQAAHDIRVFEEMTNPLCALQTERQPQGVWAWGASFVRLERLGQCVGHRGDSLRGLTFLASVNHVEAFRWGSASRCWLRISTRSGPDTSIAAFTIVAANMQGQTSACDRGSPQPMIRAVAANRPCSTQSSSLSLTPRLRRKYGVMRTNSVTPTIAADRGCFTNTNQSP